MSGGYGSSGHGSLHDRVHGTPGRAAVPGLASPARHCAVDDQPALLVAWRRDDAGAWEGQVVTLRWVDAEGWAVVLSWLAADRIVPT